MPILQEIFELKSDDGNCIANRVKHYDTGLGAIMNSCVYKQNNEEQMAAGIGGECHLFTFRHKVVTLKEQTQGIIYGYFSTR